MDKRGTDPNRERHASDRPELDEKTLEEIDKLDWSNSGAGNENTEHENQEGSFKDSTAGNEKTSGKPMNRGPLSTGSGDPTGIDAKVPPIASNSNLGREDPPESLMHLRGGHRDKWLSCRDLKHDSAPAWQRKAPLGSQDDVLGHKINDHIDRFECTMNPLKNNRFEALQVQSLDWCHQPNATWYRTNVNNGTPWALRCVFWFRKGIPLERRYDRAQYRWSDYFSLLCRLLPAGLATSVMLLIGYFIQSSSSQSDSLYLEACCESRRYPRISRNFRENRPEIHDQPRATHGRRQSYGHSRPLPSYRTFRPRFLHYIGRNSRDPMKVPKNDAEPLPKYAFISYFSDQVDVSNENDREVRYQWLYGLAKKATQECGCKAFWIAADCQPSRNEKGITKEHFHHLTNEDVYTMSDIIRGAQSTIVITLGPLGVGPDVAVKNWGRRVWTLPEVLLGKSPDIILIKCRLGEVDENIFKKREFWRVPASFTKHTFSKLDFAPLAWDDAPITRQLVDHFNGLILSRLELLDIALECFKARTLKPKYPGDRIYAMMGLLRVRPLIDTGDSAFQAFARLSLAQDSDRLLERLIFLLPHKPDEEWEKMSDQFHSSLWDIEPTCQVCGIGENDTIIVDGLYGGLIEWKRFHGVFKDQPWQALTGRVVRIAGTVWLIMLTVVNYTELPSPTHWALSLGLTTGEVSIIIAFFLIIPFFAPLIFSRRKVDEQETNPRLFGFEGYMPIEEIEEKLWGCNLGKLKWSAHGSTLSRHKSGKPSSEAAFALESGFEPADGNGHLSLPMDTYPVIPLDPVVDENGSDGYSRQTLSSLKNRARRNYGQMKIFTLVDTGVMEVTLFESIRPPIALLSGASEGGMRRAVACSLDIVTGTFYRETILRLNATTVDKFGALSRIRLGLRSPWGSEEVQEVLERGKDPNPLRRVFSDLRSRTYNSVFPTQNPVV